MKLDTWRLVEAPEGVELALRVASPFPRAIAWGIDFAMRVFVYLVVGGVLSVLGDVGTGLLLVMIFVLEWGWSIGFEVLRSGATPGKRIMGIQVVQDDGAPVGWTQSALRNLVRPADMLPFGYVFGLISCCVDSDFKRLGDRVAGTVVVHVDPEPQKKQLKMAAATPTALPVPLSLEEQAVILEFAVRAPAWTEGRQAEVAAGASELTGCESKGHKLYRQDEGPKKLYGMAAWIQGAR